MKPERIAFIGLGALGAPMAANLIRAGYALTLHNRNRDQETAVIESVHGFSPGTGDAPTLIRRAASPAEAVASATVVCLCLSDDAAVREVMLGQLGGLEQLGPGCLVIDFSTVAPATSQALAAQLAERQVAYLDAPVTGGTEGALAGTLSVLVGGEPATAARVDAILKVMGGEVIYLGKLGSASVVKVVTNMLAFIHLVAAGEAMMVPAKYGVDPDATYRAIRASSGNSFVHETESKLVLSGSYNVKFTMDLACKDLGLVNSIAEKLGVPLELGGLTQQIFRRARGLYGSEAQSPEVVRMIEAACGLELRAPGYPEELVAE
ncbi:MAG: NAD(P)-dependent oxidoreductase [Synechococcaceae bacterium WB9_2_170]|nr:NAD(P)-dependent oxidoreductase [Synechococcaceae bacterium WB9_2_170]